MPKQAKQPPKPAAAVDVAAVALACPGCGNPDKALLAVCGRVWLRASDLTPLRAVPMEGREPQAVDPVVPITDAAIVECQAEVDDDERPICRHRATLAEFAAYAAGEAVAMVETPERDGEPTPQPAAAPRETPEA